MLGVLVNALAILAGGSVGLLAKKGIPEKITNAIMTAIALCVLYIGVSGMLKGENTLVLIVSMVLGTAVGTLLDLDGRIERLGGRIERRFQRGGKRTPHRRGLCDGVAPVLRGRDGDPRQLQRRSEAGL